ncbi:MAG TPA: DOMON-like domain-containing protein [Pseudomonadales bacterium]|nr:DOMON-like domain-containing protein [Pseudomonadales bacterium]
MHFVLQPFKEPAPARIDGDIARESSHIACTWRLAGDIEQILWPSTDPSPGRKMRLWEHTCFEFFIGPVGDSRYCEFNLSPGGDWNAFSFVDVREGMQETPWLTCTASHCERPGPGRAVVTAAADFDMPNSAGPYHVGVSVVLEENAGKRHYYALAHHTGRPDFHHRPNHALVIT